MGRWSIFPCMINMVVGNFNYIWKQKKLFDGKLSNAYTFFWVKVLRHPQIHHKLHVNTNEEIKL
jgi:hypothetical protein